MIQWNKNNDAIGTVNRGVPCESGLCTLCDSACKGKCETWLASLKGRKLLYTRNFGQTTSGAWNVTSVGAGYHALRIQGYAYGAKGVEAPLTHNADDCLITNLNVTTEFVVGENVVGVDKKSVMKNGKIEKAPELDRRIDTFFRYFDGYGAMIVQMNVEDTRNGVS